MNSPAIVSRRGKVALSIGSRRKNQAGGVAILSSSASYARFSMASNRGSFTRCWGLLSWQLAISVGRCSRGQIGLQCRTTPCWIVPGDTHLTETMVYMCSVWKTSWRTKGKEQLKRSSFICLFDHVGVVPHHEELIQCSSWFRCPIALHVQISGPFIMDRFIRSPYSYIDISSCIFDFFGQTWLCHPGFTW